MDIQSGLAFLFRLLATVWAVALLCRLRDWRTLFVVVPLAAALAMQAIRMGQWRQYTFVLLALLLCSAAIGSLIIFRNPIGKYLRVLAGVVLAVVVFELFFVASMQFSEISQRQWGGITRVVISLMVLLAVAMCDHFLREWQRAQQRLNEREKSLEKEVVDRAAELARFREVMDQAGDAILVVDTETRCFVDCNLTACARLGYSRSELLDLGPAEIVVSDSPQSSERWGRRYQLTGLTDGPMQFLPQSHRRKDGSTFPVEVSIREKRFGDREYHLMVARDVTERQRAEAHRRDMEARLMRAEQLEAIGVLSKGIAHDFNNLLNPILGFTTLVEARLPEHSRERAHLREVLKAGERARKLVQQILSFRHHGEQERRPVEIAGIVSDTLGPLRAFLPATIEIRQDIGADCGLVLADPNQIHRVVMNLCTNAHQAMCGSRGVLSVALEPVEVDEEMALSDSSPEVGEYVKLTVRDTGRGIDPANRKQIFEPFFTTKEVGEGTGLGLSVAQDIVDSHGGSIRFESEPGVGTSFFVYLPQLNGKPPRRPSIPAQPPRSEHVLFVDDEEAMALLGEQMLKELGYRVTVRTSGTEALDLFRANPEGVDVVISDVTMAQMTGVELARKVMEVRPNVPVILTSGFDGLITPETAQSMGIQGFLVKPLAPRELGQTIRSALSCRGAGPPPKTASETAPSKISL